MNYVKTAMLLAFMTALFMGVGYLVGGQQGMVIAFFAALAMNIFTYWNSDKMVLRMHGAREVDERSAPELVAMVKDLADNAGLPMPKVYILETDQPNAFATGRNPDNAAVAASRGLLDRLSAEEVAGVMAHELAHIQNRDILIMTITATFAGAISMLANFALFFRNDRSPFGAVGALVAMIVAPFAAMLVQMAISRTREYAADRRGAEICGHPEWLASALDKIARGASVIPNQRAEAVPSTAHMFIINPLTAGGMDNLFSTHPNTDNRIKALSQYGSLRGPEHADDRVGRRGRSTRNPSTEVWGKRPEDMPREPDAPRGPWAGSAPARDREPPRPTSVRSGPWSRRGAGTRNSDGSNKRRSPWG